MARKRMFDKDIINQDSFFDLPMDAKALYFLLGMEADDEGFVSPKKVLRLYGGTEDSLKVLATKNYIIPFKSGVIVITDWKRNNYIQKDRLKPTIYQQEKEQLSYDEETQKYICLSNVKQVLNDCSTNVNIDKIRLDKIRLDKNSREKEKYFENEEVNNIFIEFLQQRKKLKAINSDRAIKILVNKLNEYDDDIKKKMIEQSILNSWKGIFELKEYKQNKRETFNDRLEKWAKGCE